MSIDVVSPLRQRMIEDMAARKLSAGTQRLHISSCRRFAAFLQRLPDTPPQSRTSAASSCTSPRQGRASPTATAL